MELEKLLESLSPRQQLEFIRQSHDLSEVPQRLIDYAIQEKLRMKSYIDARRIAVKAGRIDQALALLDKENPQNALIDSSEYLPLISSLKERGDKRSLCKAGDIAYFALEPDDALDFYLEVGDRKRCRKVADMALEFNEDYERHCRSLNDLEIDTKNATSHGGPNAILEALLREKRSEGVWGGHHKPIVLDKIVRALELAGSKRDIIKAVPLACKADDYETVKRLTRKARTKRVYLIAGHFASKKGDYNTAFEYFEKAGDQGMQSASLLALDIGDTIRGISYALKAKIPEDGKDSYLERAAEKARSEGLYTDALLLYERLKQCRNNGRHYLRDYIHTIKEAGEIEKAIDLFLDYKYTDEAIQVALKHDMIDKAGNISLEYDGPTKALMIVEEHGSPDQIIRLKEKIMTSRKDVQMALHLGRNQLAEAFARLHININLDWGWYSKAAEFADMVGWTEEAENYRTMKQATKQSK